MLPLLVPCLVATSLAAQTGTDVNRDAREIFETVLSPYCPGRTISNCPSPQADELRANIRAKLASGETPEEVKDELYAVFGDELRTIPRAQGFGLLAWLVPGLAFVIGGWAVLAWVRRIKDSTSSPTEAAAPIDPEANARLEAEMAELD
jgi:cytochrome c-type biogenesis protein CcmH